MKNNFAKKPEGFTRIELIFTVLGIIVLAGLLLFAVIDTRRRSRDTQKISTLRQIQFDLQAYRNDTASYPETAEVLYGAPLGSFSYQALPDGCARDTETLCASYQIGLVLEGRVGRLAGGDCLATPDGITCSP